MRRRTKADHFVETKSQNRDPPTLMYFPDFPPNKKKYRENMLEKN